MKIKEILNHEEKVFVGTTAGGTEISISSEKVREAAALKTKLHENFNDFERIWNDAGLSPL